MRFPDPAISICVFDEFVVRIIAIFL
ncbi:hypothetical protein AALP_AAs52881U000100, partial [Arabis alpina]